MQAGTTVCNSAQRGRYRSCWRQETVMVLGASTVWRTDTACPR